MKTRTFTDDKGVVHTVMDTPLPGWLELSQEQTVVGPVTMTLIERKKCPHCDQLVVMHHVSTETEGFVTLAHHQPNCAAWEATSDDVGLWAEWMITP